MSKTRLLSSIETSINETLKRLSILNGLEKKAIYNEFREWIDAIETVDKNYDVLYLNKID